MIWLQIIMALIQGLPQIIALVKEILALIKKVPSPVMQGVHRRNLLFILQTIRNRGMAKAMADLEALRNELKA